MPDDESQADENGCEERIQRTPDEEKSWSLSYIKKSKARMRRRLAELRVKIAEGKTDEEIVEETGVDFAVLDELKNELYSQDRAAVESADPVSIFIRYCLQQEGIIAELNKVIEKFMDTNQGSAIVGAIKEKSQIYDRVIKMGQDLGLIIKTGTGFELPPDMLAGRDPDEIRDIIQGELDSINELLGDAAKEPLYIIEGGASK